MIRLPLATAALVLALVALAAACRAAEEASPTVTPAATATATVTAAPTSTPPATVSVSQEGRYLLKIATGDLLQVPGLLWSPDGKHVAGVGCCIAEGGLDIYDLGTGRTSRIYEGDVVGLAWSPDSQRIAFSPYGRRADGLTGATSLAIVNLDGSELETLAEQPGADARSWSPDGRFIAFTDHKFTSSALRIEDDVYLLELSTGKTMRISESVGPAYFISLVTWSPDSSYLVIAGDYRLSEDGPFRSLVYLYDIALGKTVELGESRTDMAAAAWSPDGKSVAFVDNAGVYVYDPDAGGRRQLADGPASGPIFWSPDASWIAFRFGEPLPLIGYEGSSWQVYYIVNADGSTEPRALPPARSPSWAPDSERIAYVSEGCITGEWDIYSASVGSASVKRLTNSPGDVKEAPLWSSGGTHVIFSSIGALTAVDVDSGEARTLVRYTGEGSHLHLSSGGPSPGSPNGRYLGFQIAGGHGICD